MPAKPPTKPRLSRQHRPESTAADNRKDRKEQPLSARRDAARSLAQYCPDLDDWPGSWQIERGDAAVGQRIVAAFKPFLLDLLHQGLARKTLARHRDNLWLLGGEVIERRHRDSEPDQRPVDEVLLDLVYDEGGPLLWPDLSETQQKSFDTTCRKFYRFLVHGESGAKR